MTEQSEQPTSPLIDELTNFEQIARVITPSSGAIPNLRGIDIAGLSLPLRGEVGGDHMIYIDFDKRYDLDRRIAKAVSSGREQVATELRRLKGRAAVLIADVSGHRVTDAIVTAMLHQAFLLGTYYELDIHGRITTGLFEHLNQRFYRTTNVSKYLTMIYGEISNRGRFRFISAGHPKPLVFSRAYERFAEVGEDSLAQFPPLGMFPSGPGFSESADHSPLGVKKDYKVSTIDLLGAGDILILYTDGLSECDEGRYFTLGLADSVREVCDCPAAQIVARIRDDLLKTTVLDDDTSFVVIKRRTAADVGEKQKLEAPEEAP